MITKAPTGTLDKMNETKFSLGNYTIKGKAFKVFVDDAANSTLNGNKILTSADQGGYQFLAAPAITPVLTGTEYNPTFPNGVYTNSAFTTTVSAYAGPIGGSQFTLTPGTYSIQLFLLSCVNIDSVWIAISDVLTPLIASFSSSTHGVNNIAGVADTRSVTFILKIVNPATFFFRINQNKIVPGNPPASYSIPNLVITKL